MKDIIDFSSRDLLLGYTLGIFPMANASDDDSIMWICPKKRGIIPLESLHISRSLRRKINSKKYHSTFNKEFYKVVSHCRNRKETWINDVLLDKYMELHKKKFAHSVEIWLGEELVGGLFGVSIGACFFGESMFSLKNDGSKLALVSITNRLKSCGHKLFDTQFFTPHLGNMGGIEISKIKYDKILQANIKKNVKFQYTGNEKELLFVPKKN